MYLALFCGGELISLQAADNDLQVKMVVEKSLDSLENGEYTARGFLWESAGSAKPYCDAAETAVTVSKVSE